MGKYYVAGIPFDSENCLMHYGVKNMEWGKHKFGIDADDRYIKWLKNAGQNIGKFANNVGQGVSNAATTAARTVGSAVNKGANFVTGTANNVGRGVSNFVTGKQAEANLDKARGDWYDKAREAHQYETYAKEPVRSMGYTGSYKTDRPSTYFDKDTGLTGRDFSQQVADQHRVYAGKAANARAEADKLEKKYNEAEAAYNRTLPRIANNVGTAASEAINAVGNGVQNAGQAIANTPKNVENWYTGQPNADRAEAIDRQVQEYERLGDMMYDRGMKNEGDRYHQSAANLGRVADANQARYDTAPRQRLNNAIDAVGNAAQNVGNGAKGFINSAGKWVTDTAGNVGKGVSNAAQNVGNGAKGFINSAGQWVSTAANDVGNAVGNAANDVKNFVGQTAQNVGNAVSGAAEQARGGIGGLFDRVGNAVTNAGNAVGDWAGNTAKNVGNAVTNAGNAVGDWGRNAVQDVGQAVTNAGNAVGDWGRNAAQNVGQAAGNAVNAVGGAANAAGNWIGERASDIGTEVQSLTNTPEFRNAAAGVNNVIDTAGNAAQEVKGWFSNGDQERQNLAEARANASNYKEDDPEFLKSFKEHYPAEYEQYMQEKPVAEAALAKAEKDYMDFSNNPVNTVARALNLPNNKGNWAFAVPGNEQYLHTMNRGFIPKTNNVAEWFTGDNYKKAADTANSYANDYDELANKAYAYGKEAKETGRGPSEDFWKSEGDYVKNVYGQEQRDIANANMNLYNNAPRQKIVNAAQNVGQSVVNAGNAVGDWAGQTARNVGGAVSNAAQNAGQWVGNAAQNVGKAAVNAGNWISDRASDAASNTTWDNAPIQTYENTIPENIILEQIIPEKIIRERVIHSDIPNTATANNKPDGVSDAFWAKYTADGGTREEYERNWR